MRPRLLDGGAPHDGAGSGSSSARRMEASAASTSPSASTTSDSAGSGFRPSPWARVSASLAAGRSPRRSRMIPISYRAMPTAAGMNPASSSVARRASDSAVSQSPLKRFISARNTRHIPGKPLMCSRRHQRSWASVHWAARFQSPRAAHASIVEQQTPPAIAGSTSPPTAAIVASSTCARPLSTSPRWIRDSPSPLSASAPRFRSANVVARAPARSDAASASSNFPSRPSWNARTTASQPWTTVSSMPVRWCSARFSHAAATEYVPRSRLC